MIEIKMTESQWEHFVNSLHYHHNAKQRSTICLCDLCLATAKYVRRYKDWEKELEAIGIHCKVVQSS